MNDLPFSFPSGFSPNNPAIETVDNLNVSSSGNHITSRYVVKKGTNFTSAMTTLINSISSGAYRVNPKMDLGPNSRTGQGDIHSKLFVDFYSPKINRDSIRPGTVVYDPSGHILMVYKVRKDGNIKNFPDFWPNFS